MQHEAVRPRKRNDLKLYPMWDELVIYAGRQEKAFSLNPSARAIWDLCDGQHTIPQICHQLSHHFDAPAAELEQDVEIAIRQLHHHGLLDLPEGESGKTLCEAE